MWQRHCKVTDTFYITIECKHVICLLQYFLLFSELIFPLRREKCHSCNCIQSLDRHNAILFDLTNAKNMSFYIMVSIPQLKGFLVIQNQAIVHEKIADFHINYRYFQTAKTAERRSTQVNMFVSTALVSSTFYCYYQYFQYFTGRLECLPSQHFFYQKLIF